jgi:hypothetical protein
LRGKRLQRADSGAQVVIRQFRKQTDHETIQFNLEAVSLAAIYKNSAFVESRSRHLPAAGAAARAWPAGSKRSQSTDNP